MWSEVAEFLSRNWFGLIFFFVGLGAVLVSIFLLTRGIASKKWPTCIGKVVTSGIKAKTDSDGDVTYYPEVLYEYVVRGTTFNGNEIRVISSGTGPGAARATANRYPEGAIVTVYYKPGKPETSLLEPGGQWFSAIFIMLVGLIFMAVGGIVIPLFESGFTP